MAFLFPIMIFSIKRHYSNMYLWMVIHINSSKNPICLFPCRLITIYIILFWIWHLSFPIVFRHLFYWLNSVTGNIDNSKMSQNGHSLTHVVCMTLIHENFTSAKDIQQGGLVCIYMGCNYTLNSVVSHMCMHAYIRRLPEFSTLTWFGRIKNG
jgi:hypothetical protein